MRKYRVGDCIGYTGIRDDPSFTIVDTIEHTPTKLWGRWFRWDNERKYLREKTVKFYIPKEYC